MLYREYSDIAQVNGIIRELGEPIFLEPADPEHFHLQGRLVRTGKLRIFRTASTSGYHIRHAGELDDFQLAIQRPGLDLDKPSSAPAPVAQVRILLDRKAEDGQFVPAMSSQKGVLIDAATLTRAVCDRLGHGDLDRISFMTGNSPPCLHLACESICDTLFLGITQEDGLMANPLVVANLQDALINTVLYGARHSYSEALTQGSVTLPHVMRKAVDYMHANAHQPVTPTDVALASGLSIRSLQLSFRERLGVTPQRYLRKIRLQRAFDDLKASNGTSVGQIAERWGFFSPGEFARLFRAEFGQRPAELFRG